MTPDRIVTHNACTTSPSTEEKAPGSQSSSPGYEVADQVAQECLGGYSLWTDYRAGLGLLLGYHYTLPDTSPLKMPHVPPMARWSQDAGNNTNDFEDHEQDRHPPAPEEYRKEPAPAPDIQKTPPPRGLPKDLMENLGSYLVQVKMLSETKSNKGWDPSSALEVVKCFAKDCATLKGYALGTASFQRRVKEAEDNLWTARFYLLRRLFKEKRTKDVGKYLDLWVKPLGATEREEAFLHLLALCQEEHEALLGAALILQARRKNIFSAQACLDHYLTLASYARGPHAFKMWQVACQQWPSAEQKAWLLAIAQAGLAEWTYEEKVGLEDEWLQAVFSSEHGVSEALVTLWKGTQQGAIQQRLFKTLLLFIAQKDEAGFNAVVELLLDNGTLQAGQLQLLYEVDSRWFRKYAHTLTSKILRASPTLCDGLPWESLLQSVFDDTMQAHLWIEVLSHLMKRSEWAEKMVTWCLQGRGVQQEASLLLKILLPSSLRHLSLSVLAELRVFMCAPLQSGALPSMKLLEALFTRLRVDCPKTQRELYHWITEGVAYGIVSLEGDFRPSWSRSVEYLLLSSHEATNMLGWLIDRGTLLPTMPQKDLARWVAAIVENGDAHSLRNFVQVFSCQGPHAEKAAEAAWRFLEREVQNHGVTDSCIEELLIWRALLGSSWLASQALQDLMVAILTHATPQQQERALQEQLTGLTEKHVLLRLYQRLNRRDLIDEKLVEWPQISVWLDPKNPSLALCKLLVIERQMALGDKGIEALMTKMSKENQEIDLPGLITLSWNHLVNERSYIKTMVFDIYKTLILFWLRRQDYAFDALNVLTEQLIPSIPQEVLPLESCFSWWCENFPMESHRVVHANQMFTPLLCQARTLLSTLNGHSDPKLFEAVLRVFQMANTFAFIEFHTREGMSYIFLEALKRDIFAFVRDKYLEPIRTTYAWDVTLCEFKVRSQFLCLDTYELVKKRLEWVGQCRPKINPALRIHLLCHHLDYLTHLWKSDQQTLDGTGGALSKLGRWTNAQKDGQWMGHSLYKKLLFDLADTIIDLLNRPDLSSQKEELLWVKRAFQSVIYSMAFLQKDKPLMMWGGEEKNFGVTTLNAFMDRLMALLQPGLDVLKSRPVPAALTDGEMFYLWTYSIETIPQLLLDFANDMAKQIPLSRLHLHVVLSASLFNIHGSVIAAQQRVVKQLRELRQVVFYGTDNYGASYSNLPENQYACLAKDQDTIIRLLIQKTENRAILENNNLVIFYQMLIDQVTQNCAKQNRQANDDENEFLEACLQSAMILVDKVKAQITSRDIDSDEGEVGDSSSEEEFADTHSS